MGDCRVWVLAGVAFFTLFTCVVVTSYKVNVKEEPTKEEHTNKNILTYELVNEKIIIENIEDIIYFPSGNIGFTKDDKEYRIRAPYSYVEYK